MSEVLGWTKLFFDVLFRAVAMTVGLLQLVIFYKVFRWWAYERPGISRGGTASPQVLLRRLWCRHHHVARGRDSYGKTSTICVRCNIDVNAGRPSEEWR